MKFKLMSDSLNDQRLALAEEKKSIQVKEEDLHFEVQQLLQKIDEHVKLNEKVNKHYQKRLTIIGTDLLSI